MTSSQRRDELYSVVVHKGQRQIKYHSSKEQDVHSKSELGDATIPPPLSLYSLSVPQRHSVSFGLARSLSWLGLCNFEAIGEPVFRRLG